MKPPLKGRSLLIANFMEAYKFFNEYLPNWLVLPSEDYAIDYVSF